MNVFLKKSGRYLLPALLVFIMVMLVIFPDKYASSTFIGVKVWALNVLPSLLPFFFLTTLLTKTGSLDGLTKGLSPVTRVLYRSPGIAAYVQLMSFLSGYPVGVKIAADLHAQKTITSRQVTKLSTFSSTSGPLFIVGSVGTAMFGNKKIGFILLAAHLLATIVNGLIFRFLPSDDNAPTTFTKDCQNALYESIYSAVISVAIVGGFIAVFFTFAQILSDVGVFKPLETALSPLIGQTNAQGVCLGLIECTFACKTFALNISPLSISLACGAISFGGASVWCQSAIYLNSAKADFKMFALSKLTQTVISTAICYLICVTVGL